MNRPRPPAGREGPPAPPRIALLGLRGSGKTTIGRALGRRLGWPFFDLDEELAQAALAEHPGRTPASAGELLATLGEAPFRELERRALECVADRPGPLVLATGGGVVETAAARTILAHAFRCVWLRVPSEILIARVRADPKPRPPLVPGDLAAEFRVLAARRDPLFADLCEIEWNAAAPTPEEEAERLAARLAAPPPRDPSASCRG